MGVRQEQKKRKVQRLLEMEKALALGLSGREIQIRFSTQYDVTERQIRNDIFAIYKKWADDAESEGNGNIRRNQTRQLIRSIVRGAMADKAWSAAATAVSRLMELDGLKQQIEVKVTGEIEHRHDIQAMTSGDKRDRLEELMTKANAMRAKMLNGSGDEDPIH